MGFRLNAWILDPFTGGSTTGIAANLLNRKFVGIDREEKFLQLSRKRKTEIENRQIQEDFRNKIDGFNQSRNLSYYLKDETDKFTSASK